MHAKTEDVLEYAPRVAKVIVVHALGHVKVHVLGAKDHVLEVAPGTVKAALDHVQDVLHVMDLAMDAQDHVSHRVAGALDPVGVVVDAMDAQDHAQDHAVADAWADVLAVTDVQQHVLEAVPLLVMVQDYIVMDPTVVFLQYSTHPQNYLLL